MVQFNDEETKNLNRNIKKLSYKLRQDIKNIEKNIKIYMNEDISNPDGSEGVNDLQYQIKENMSENILKEFNSFSKKFKLNEEIYSQKCKELLIIEEDDNMLELNDISTNNSDGSEGERNRDGGNFLMKEEPDILLQSRENELNEIVRGVTKLQELFKDMQIVVVEQGSILDRIDYNIEIGFNNISKGKKKIISANEKHKSSCYRNIILLLLICIFVESMLLLFKIF